MPSEIVLVTQLAIGLVFLRSSLGKLQHPGQFLRGLTEYDILPEWLVHPAGILLIGAEVMIALSHLSGWFLPLIVPASIALLSAFVAAMIVTIRRGVTVSCLCFSAGDGQEIVSIRTVVRLTLLLGVEMLLWHSLRSEPYWPPPYALNPRELLLALLCAGLVLNVTSWILAAPEIVVAQRLCRTYRERST